MGLVDLTCLLAWLLPGLLGCPTPIRRLSLIRGSAAARGGG